MLAGQSFLLIFFNFIIFVLMLLPFNKATKGVLLREKYNKNELILGYVILYAINSTFAFFNADFWHYLPIFAKMSTASKGVHIEPIYFKLYVLLGRRYLLWRFVVWTSSILITIKLFRRYSLNLKVALIFYTLLYSYMAITMRGSLAVAIMILGCSYVDNGVSTTVKQKIIGIILICVSYFFHRSMLLSIAMLVVMFVRMTPLITIISLIAFPVLYRYIPSLIDFVTSNTQLLGEDDMGLSQKIAYYSSQHRTTITIYGQLREILNYSSFWLALTYMTKNIVFSKKDKYPSHIRALYNYWYWMSYLGFLFYNQEASSFLSKRFLLLGYLPMVIVLTYQYSHKQKPQKALRWIMFLSLAYLLFTFMIQFRDTI